MVSVIAFAAFTASAQAADLRCEYAVNPMNLDVVQPHLSWRLDGSGVGVRQTAYQVVVSSSLEGLEHLKGDLWNSGKVLGSQTLEVLYKGSKLSSGQTSYWKVRVWDEKGLPLPWSSPASWTTGLLSSGDWKASWIAADPSVKSPTFYLRKEFSLSKKIKRAITFSTGLGQYELWINGRPVGRDWLKPGWTQYGKSILTDSYVVTDELNQGLNSVAVHVGNGMYDMSLDKRGSQQTNSWGTKKALFQMLVEYVDGSRQWVLSDGTWQSHESAETYSGVYGGEDFDARKEPAGWKLPRFQAADWKPVTLVDAPKASLRGLTHANPPLRVMEVRGPVDGHLVGPNALVLDLGQNAPYVPQVLARGPAGCSITMKPAEVLKPDGSINQETMRAGKKATYTLSGNGLERWSPSFWYCGSRYWQIEAADTAGRPIPPSQVLRSFSGLMVHADIPSAGEFKCSSQLFNDTERIIRWAMRSNFASVISDCPHREKSGWLEQDHLVGEGLMYSFDMSTMFRKVVQDMADTQLPSGMVPTMAPEYFIYDAGFRDSVEWGGAYLLLPDLTARFYGENSLVGSHLDAMKAYLDYLGTRAKDGILSNGLGDWNGGGNDPRTPVGITDTAYYYALLKICAQFEAEHGHKTTAQQVLKTAESVRQSFLKAFYDKATGKVGTGSQSGQATALDFDMIDAADVPKAFQQLLADIVAHGFGVDCGEVGHPSMLRVLTRFGRADLVAKIHLQSERPGYGYQIKKGLTTLAESWDASYISYNHFMLGHIMNWFYGDLVGIKPDPKGEAFSKILVQPHLVPQLSWATAHYDSIRGRISSGWKTDGARCTLTVSVPANCTATVYVPTRAGSTVKVKTGESRSLNVFISQQPKDGYEPIHVSSGIYTFESLYR